MDWKAIEAMTDKIVLGAFGETVLHRPLKNGSSDPSRPQQSIRGVLHAPNADGTVSLGNGIITTIATTETALAINRADYPSIDIRQGDEFQATDMPGQPYYEVKRISSRFSSIVVVHLGPTA